MKIKFTIVLLLPFMCAVTSFAQFEPHYHYGELRFVFNTGYIKKSEFLNYPSVTYKVYNSRTSFNVVSTPSQFEFPEVSYQISNRYFNPNELLNVCQDFSPSYIIYLCKGNETVNLPFSSNEEIRFNTIAGISLKSCSRTKSVSSSDCSKGSYYTFLTKEMKESELINDMRTQYNRNEPYILKKGNVFTGDFGLLEFIGAGMNLTQQYVGGFYAEMYPDNTDSNNNIIKIYNDVNLKSLVLHYLGFNDISDTTKPFPEKYYRLQTNTPLGETRQIFVWKEYVR